MIYVQSPVWHSPALPSIAEHSKANQSKEILHLQLSIARRSEEQRSTAEQGTPKQRNFILTKHSVVQQPIAMLSEVQPTQAKKIVLYSCDVKQSEVQQCAV